MNVSTWMRAPKVRRSLALASLVLSISGLYLVRADAARPAYGIGAPVSPTRVAFAGGGVHGTLSTSQAELPAGQGSLYAVLDIEADALERGVERAPLSLAVVLDTSGSMSGSKIEEAKRSVRRLIEGMREDDEVSLVRYSDSADVIQPLARVGDVRRALLERVASLEAAGGTNIPSGLSQGDRQLSRAGFGRVKRVVLVSDGLDSSRARSEELARDGYARGVTVSALGIGLDFDESYMGAVAQIGHGNFGFSRDGADVARFLDRELTETATTTVEGLRLKLDLPRGLALSRVVGASARQLEDGVEVDVGAISAGDHRRIVVELRSTLETGERASIAGAVSFQRVGKGPVRLALAGIDVRATDDLARADRSRDAEVVASAVSALASARQLEAVEAYARGDVRQATDLLTANEQALAQAIAASPAAAPALERQAATVATAKRDFMAAPPKSAAGNAAAKAVFERDAENTKRKAF